jgi:hypothetical protein
MRAHAFLICLCVVTVSLLGCTDDDAGNGATSADTSGVTSADTSGATSADTSGAMSADTSGATSADTSGATSADTSGATSADTSGATSADTSGATSADTSGATSADTSGADGEDTMDPPPAGSLLLFEQPMPWTERVDGEAKSAESDAIIQWLSDNGSWGAGSFRMDFSIDVLYSDAATPIRSFTPTDEFYVPDCDEVPFPVPVGGNLEGEDGYECTQDGDCHLLVVHQPTKTLYEMWRANIVGDQFDGGCAATWDLARTYPDSLRGDHCTSADAGGLPITPLLFSADEVAAGEVAHAIRFILPNNRIRNRVFVRPSTHSTGATSGGADAPPYGVRFRLRADYPLESLPTEGARVIARGLQRYGMILSDAGNIALTGLSDRHTAHTWEEVGVDSRSLDALQVSDFEVVQFSAPITWTGDCVRNAP